MSLRPISRRFTAPYAQYWDGFESNWLKGPLDEIHNMASQKQAREGIKRLALSEARRTGIPPNLALGNISGFQKPKRLGFEDRNPLVVRRTSCRLMMTSP